jgi:hypothetical protein
MPMKIFVAMIMLLPGWGLRAADWPREIDSPQGTITIYQPQIDSYKGNSMSARAAISVTARDATEPVFGAVWLDCRVLTDRPTRTVRLLEVKVSQIKFPEGKDEETGAISRTVEEQIPGLDLTFSLDELLESLDTAQKEKETSKEIEVTPPRIIVKDHPAVLVLLDGDPVFVDVEGTSLRRVANTPFFLVQETGSGMLYLKGGEIWYSAREITGRWEVTGTPPREAIDLAAKSASDAQAGEESGANDSKAKTGKIPEIVVSTVPAELIATDGPVQLSPIKGTGLLYATNTPSKLFLAVSSQDYYILISGRWYTARKLDGPWSNVASDRLPADFASIPPGSERDDVLASVAGTVPAKEAVLDAQIPQTAEVDRMQASSQVQYDGDPQFEPIENTEMGYALNSSTAIIRVRGRYYNCDKGVWFEGPTPNGPWGVCIAVPPDIYTIPPRCPVYYVRYVRVYSYTPEVAYVGYTSGYTGCYVHGGTVVYGTGYYYRPWFRRSYFPRPWTWGFGVHYDPWTGWSMGYSTGWWRPRGWFAFNNRGMAHEGWWGPVGYRPVYRPFAGPVYREGYHPVYRPLLPERSERGPAYGGSRSTGPIRNTTLYDRWTRGVTRPTSGDRPRQAIDMVRPETRPAPAVAPPGVARPDVRRTPRASERANDVYATPEGNIVRKTPQGWQQRDRNTWKKTDDAPAKTGVDHDSNVRQRGAERSSSFRRPAPGRPAQKEPKPDRDKRGR